MALLPKDGQNNLAGKNIGTSDQLQYDQAEWKNGQFAIAQMPTKKTFHSYVAERCHVDFFFNLTIGTLSALCSTSHFQIRMPVQLRSYFH
jgi:hypothetical protein